MNDAQVQVELCRVPGGVVIGRIQTSGGKRRTECWGLFTSVDQFDACSGLDDIRFTHPLTHARLVKEFRNACEEAVPTSSAR